MSGPIYKKHPHREELRQAVPEVRLYIFWDVSRRGRSQNLPGNCIAFTLPQVAAVSLQIHCHSAAPMPQWLAARFLHSPGTIDKTMPHNWLH